MEDTRFPSRADLTAFAVVIIVLGLLWWAMWPTGDRWTPASRSELVQTTGELRTAGGKKFYLYTNGRTLKLVCPIGLGGRGPSFWCFPDSLRDWVGKTVTVSHSERRGVIKVAPVYEIHAATQVLVRYDEIAREAAELGDLAARRSDREIAVPIILTVVVGWFTCRAIIDRRRAVRSAGTARAGIKEG